MAKKKPCKTCAKKGKVKVGYAPLVIFVGNWAVDDDLKEFVTKRTEDGGYVYLNIIGVPPCIPTPVHPCPKK